jgi:TPR repeat protein
MRGNLLESWIRNPTDYTHERDIGAGTLGLVALVCNKKTGEYFARREVRDATGAAPAAAGDGAVPAKRADQTFMQEIQLFIKVKPHPAICTFHGYWFATSRCVLLQYLPDGSLHTILTSPAAARPPWYTATLRAKVVFGFAAAMMHLHAHGAIHRYLTPKNIMFDPAHEPRLVDFGYAKISLDAIQLSQVAGGDNSCYLAPEAIENLEYDQSLDVFAFAMIVYHLVTNIRPYSDCRTAFQIGAAIKEGRRPEVPACHKILQQIMRLGWETAPAQRPSFAEIVSQLMLVDDPLFEGVDMADYRDYRDRVMKATEMRREDRELFNLRADLAPERVAEFAAVKAVADSGDPEAMVRLGRFYQRGHGVVESHEDAFECYERAANANNPTGIFLLAIMLHTGHGREQDLKAAVGWYRKAADAGIHTAELLLAGLMLSGEGFAKSDPIGAAAIYRKFADPPFLNKDAQYHLGRLYDEGVGVMRDALQAQRYFELSHNQGGDAATCDLAAIFLQGRDGIPADVALGIETLNQAASRDNAMAHYNLGFIYHEGQYGQAADPEAAREHFKIAAEQGVPLAQVMFGTILVHEGRAEADEAVKEEKLALAADYFREAAIAGCPPAQNNYGKMLMTGEGVPRNITEAKKYLMLAMWQNQWMAFVNMAEILMRGLDGSMPNRAQAIGLLTRARDNGNRVAAAKLEELGL